MIELALMCLAQNVYYEARNQPLSGQLAVAQVTLNRVEAPSYPDTVCGVVNQYKQFSWYWDGLSDVPQNEEAWQTAQLVASAALDGSGHSYLQGVTHYHADTVEPYWSKKLQYVAQIGDHVFYIE